MTISDINFNSTNTFKRYNGLFNSLPFLNENSKKIIELLPANQQEELRNQLFSLLQDSNSGEIQTEIILKLLKEYQHSSGMNNGVFIDTKG